MASVILADNGTVSGSAGIKSSADSSGVLALATGSGTTAVTIDASQNMGLGVTPSAWTATKALQIGQGAAVYGGTGQNGAYISSNAYYGSGWTYIGTGYATKYEQSESNSGAHKWWIAPSGTAGNAITFTQAMTLDASGNLGIGTTSPDGKFVVLGTAGSNPYSHFKDANGADFFIQAVGNSDCRTGTASNHPWLMFTNNSEKARIDSSGNLQVGTTGQLSNERFAVVSGGTTQTAYFKGTSGATDTTINVWNATTTGDAKFIQFITEASPTLRGSITYNRAGGLTAYNVTSDYRAKDIIGPVSDSGTLIDSVPVYMGKMHGAEIERPMFIAHETPSYAHTGEKDAVDQEGNPVLQQMDPSALVPVLWAEVQSLRKRLAALESK